MVEPPQKSLVFQGYIEELGALIDQKVPEMAPNGPDLAVVWFNRGADGIEAFLQLTGETDFTNTDRVLGVIQAWEASK